MPFREWIHSGGSNLEMENGEERREGQTEENDTDLCRGHVPSPFVQRVGMASKMGNLSPVYGYAAQGPNPCNTPLGSPTDSGHIAASCI